MSADFFSRLERRSRAIDSLLCVGLDPHPADLSSPTAACAEEFCTRIIEKTRPYAAAFKPNAAFFEALGPDGWSALARVIASIGDEVPVILDAKRGDIASTARAYARSAFEILGAGAITVNAYMGWDTVRPYLAYPNVGVWVLCRTSNPGADAIQNLLLHPTEAIPNQRLFERIASWIPGHQAEDRVGMVVGATQPEALRSVRKIAPRSWILSPGVGPQGADLHAAMQAGLRSDGRGILIHSSRSIARAKDPAQAARGLRDAIRHAVANHANPDPDASTSGAAGNLADRLFRSGCVQFGRFTLRSGLISPIYIDMRRIVGDPALLSQVATAYSGVLDQLFFDRIAAIPTAGLPIATTISLQRRCPLIFPRKKAKAHGTKAAIEGPYEAGERVVMIDDLATRGTSLLEALPQLQQVGLEVTDAVVLVDRSSGAPELLAAQGIRLHAIFRLDRLLERWFAAGMIDRDQYQQTVAFLTTSKPATS